MSFARLRVIIRDIMKWFNSLLSNNEFFTSIRNIVTLCGLPVTLHYMSERARSHFERNENHPEGLWGFCIWRWYLSVRNN